MQKTKVAEHFWIAEIADDVGYEILEDSDLKACLSERYASYDDGPGAQFERGELGLGELAALADKLGEPDRRSGKQELFESIINRHIR